MALVVPHGPPSPSPRPLRLGVLASGQGSNFEALVQASRHGALHAEVVGLVVNTPHCKALARAERLNVGATVMDHRRYTSREALDHALVDHFRALQVDVLIMAGWMRIVSPVLCQAYDQRLVNIHPSLLPAFRGLNAMERALAAGVCITGCTAHLVVPEVDAGPILIQAAVPTYPDDTVATLAPRIHAQEHRILPVAVAMAGRHLFERP
ncbi:MAG: phosphoribosylglycinamide formyltransferase [Synechococcus sp. SB0668_bin_15]|nr:phosphoribosylglycinamide formyltransferase [Synechococcus sp. SB0668_bin_15]MYC48943.1 phosphoribosylglycinamide formyltransferase [Synechococcus sp. SB0662_bin_14]